MVQDRAIVTIEHEYAVIYKLSNSVIFSYLEWSLTRVLRSWYLTNVNFIQKSQLHFLLSSCRWFIYLNHSGCICGTAIRASDFPSKWSVTGSAPGRGI